LVLLSLLFVQCVFLKQLALIIATWFDISQEQMSSEMPVAIMPGPPYGGVTCEFGVLSLGTW